MESKGDMSTDKIVDEYVDSMTEKESKCVDMLRERLREKYPTLPKNDTSQVVPFKGSEVDTSTYCLLRFVRARKCNVDAAFDMARQGIVFREKWVPSEIIDSTKYEIHPIMKRFRTGGIAPWARDLEGAPIIYDRLGQADPKLFSAIDMEDLVKMWITYDLRRAELTLKAMAENSTKTRPQHGVVVVHDLSGLGMKHIGRKSIDLFGKIATVLDTNYPELLKRCIIVNAPWVFPMFWKVAKYFIDAKTREKIDIVSGNPFPTLSKYIDPKNIPAYLKGGERVNDSDGDASCSDWISPGASVPKEFEEEFKAEIEKYEEKFSKSGYRIPSDWLDWMDKKKLKGLVDKAEEEEEEESVSSKVSE